MKEAFKILSKANLGFFPKFDEGDSLMRELESCHKFICGVQDKYHQTRNQVLVDTDSSPVGKMKTMARTMAPLIKDVMNLKSQSGPMKKAKEGIKQFQEKIMGFSARPDSMIGELRQQEIRSYVRSLPPEKRSEFCLQAVGGGDHETIFSVMNGAAFLSGINPVIQKELKNKIVAINCAPELQNLNKLLEATEIVETAANHMYKDLIENVDFTLSPNLLPKELIPAYKETGQELPSLKKSVEEIKRIGVEAYKNRLLRPTLPEGTEKPSDHGLPEPQVVFASSVS